jgi:hypothetical protein
MPLRASLIGLCAGFFFNQMSPVANGPTAELSPP